MVYTDNPRVVCFIQNIYTQHVFEMNPNGSPTDYRVADHVFNANEEEHWQQNKSLMKMFLAPLRECIGIAVAMKWPGP